MNTDLQLNESKDFKSNIKYRSSSNLVKNPMISKHIGSRILTLNSDDEEKSNRKPNEVINNIIDSDNLEENEKNFVDKPEKYKLFINKANENDSISEEKAIKKKLGYHRKKAKNLNQETFRKIKPNTNKANKNQENFHSEEKLKLKSGLENFNLLKKFNLWKTIDNEITNANFDDMKNSIRILLFYIKILKVI